MEGYSDFVLSKDHSPEFVGFQTGNFQSKQWLNAGLQWLYAYNHEEAIKCFKEVVKIDENCVLALFLLSYANGVNYNNGECEEDEGAFPSNADSFKYGLLAKQKVSSETSPVEKALAEAIVLRNASPGPESLGSPEEITRMRTALNSAFAISMKRCHEAFPSHADVTFLYIEACMNLKPWMLFQKDGSPEPPSGSFPGTQAIISTLQNAVKVHPNHIGLLHLYVHAWEMAPEPGNCKTEALHLATIVKGTALGHLLHMPSHILVLVGDYKDAVSANKEAISADQVYVSKRGLENFYTMYRCHDYHMLIFAAMLCGRKEDALEYAHAMTDHLTSETCEKFMVAGGMADFLEAFTPMKFHVFVRFGMWNEILEVKFMENQELYCTFTVTQHYARGLAFAALNKVPKAEREQQLFETALVKIPKKRILFNNTVSDILGVAKEMLAGEIKYRKGEYESAFQHLRKAVQLDDGLPYDEPWGWLQPTRHALGSLLLENGQKEEALSVFQQDLKRNPKNIWSLTGLRLCEALPEESLHVLKDAEAHATVPVVAPCFCMLSKLK